MYLEHFEFESTPFRHDTKNMFWGAQYCQAKGFVYESLIDDNRVCCVLGDHGTGKTQLLRQLFDEEDQSLLIAKIWNPQIESSKFLLSILKQFGFEPFEASDKEYFKILRAFLDHEQNRGKTPVIVIDQADKLPAESSALLGKLAGIRNLECDKLRIVFFGRSEFEQTLDTSNLGGQALRRFHLFGLAEDEIGDYLEHHLEAVGQGGKGLITSAAAELLAEYSGGAPKQVNELALHALEEAAGAKKQRVIKASVEKAVKKLKLSRKQSHHEARYSVAPNSSPFRGEAIEKLVITREGKVLGAHLLTAKRTMIGRHPTSDIILERSAVSVHHAQVFVDDRGFHLLDMNSTNGTLVNFRKTRHHLLRNSDLIMIGDYRLKFVAAVAENRRPASSDMRSMSDTVVIDHDDTAVRQHLRRVK
ncbi:MAG: FHA domain-containing protein [Gammaproteobacteria bacterium]|nr:FHA domain-containing protein [Gammaproteobacteria bacterium]